MILDHVDQIDLSDEFVVRHQNDLNSLHYLAVGLDFLFQQVDHIESIMRLRQEPGVRGFFVGNHPVTEDLPIPLVTCAFHWYAVSACNYVKLVGWLRQQRDPSAPPADEYTKSVLPAVLSWRNKVAAHFARTTPPRDRRDVPAEREASTLLPIGFSGDSFCASPMTLYVRRGGEASTSAAIRPWSLTKVHLQLSQRYWPGAVSKDGGK